MKSADSPVWMGALRICMQRPDAPGAHVCALSAGWVRRLIKMRTLPSRRAGNGGANDEPEALTRDALAAGVRRKNRFLIEA